MKNLSGINRAVEILRPHRQEFEEFLEQENQKFKELLQTDHVRLGRIIKCHLIIESYMERLLCDRLNLSDISNARLTYHQKVMLLPGKSVVVVVLKSDLLLINKIRNKLAHDLNVDVLKDDINSMIKFLEISGRNTENMDICEVIEAFTVIACTWLLVQPPHLEELFKEAFRDIVIETDNGDE